MTQNSCKKPVYATYDTQFKTWNVINLKGECLFYGDIFETEQWLLDNSATYEDVSPT
jgi:hypothetical protein